MLIHVCTLAPQGPSSRLGLSSGPGGCQVGKRGSDLRSAGKNRVPPPVPQPQVLVWETQPLVGDTVQQYHLVATPVNEL